MRRWGVMAAAAALLAGCVPATTPPGDPWQRPVQVMETSAPASARTAAQNFIQAVSRVEPVAERICAERTRGVACDFRIVIDDRAGQPPNAFQTRDRAGRPVIGFTLALVGDARNVDEIAFVMGHEAAHHILGHIDQTTQSAATGAIMAGVLASLNGADTATVRAAQEMGATVGARRYSKAFELEADALGAEIAWYAGFDPVRGAGFFTRLPDPGNRFLGSHPPNAERIAVVRRAVARLP